MIYFQQNTLECTFDLFNKLRIFHNYRIRKDKVARFVERKSKAPNRQSQTHLILEEHIDLEFIRHQPVTHLPLHGTQTPILRYRTRSITHPPLSNVPFVSRNRQLCLVFKRAARFISSLKLNVKLIILLNSSSHSHKFVSHGTHYRIFFLFVIVSFPLKIINAVFVFQPRILFCLKLMIAFITKHRMNILQL